MNGNEEDNGPAEDFEGTPEEKMRFEIELLKLKISAELGGEIGKSDLEMEVPPEVEKAFLEQVLDFHKTKGEVGTVRDQLGHPTFPPAESLSEGELLVEWKKVEALYESHFIAVNFIEDYPLSLRYTFMTGELLDEEFDSYGAGFTTNYIYEEFHPNLAAELEDATERFMHEVVEGEFSEIMLADTLMSKSGSQKTAAEVQLLLNRFHLLFPLLENWEFTVAESYIQPEETVKEEIPRFGFTAGTVRYTATTAEGERQEIEGPFKLFMQHRWGMWEVMNFYLHGFSWK